DLFPDLGDERVGEIGNVFGDVPPGHPCVYPDLTAHAARHVLQIQELLAPALPELDDHGLAVDRVLDDLGRVVRPPKLREARQWTTGRHPLLGRLDIPVALGIDGFMSRCQRHDCSPLHSYTGLSGQRPVASPPVSEPAWDATPLMIFSHAR